MKKPKTEMLLITPKLADEFLTLNVHNRGVTNAIVEQLEHALRTGDWQPTLGLPVMISTERVLMNGQHRLFAITNTGISAYLLVERDVDPKLMPKIDLPFNTRKLGDNLRLSGVEDAKRKVEIATAILKIKTGRPAQTVDDKMAAIEEHKIGIGWALALKNEKGFTAARVRGPLALAYEKAPQAIDEMVARAVSGLNMHSDADPAFQLRRVCLVENINDGTSGSRQLGLRVLQCCFAAANGREIKIVRPSDEAFEFFMGRAPRARNPVKAKKLKVVA